MAQYEFNYKEDEGYEIQRSGKSIFVTGEIEATVKFDFDKNENSYEWNGEKISDSNTEVYTVTDENENKVFEGLSGNEFLKFERYMKDKALEYFNEFGIQEFMEAC